MGGKNIFHNSQNREKPKEEDLSLRIFKSFYGGKDRLFFIENEKRINKDNTDRLKSMVQTLLILLTLLLIFSLIGVFFSSKFFDAYHEKLVPVFVIFEIFYTVTLIRIKKIDEEKQYEKSRIYIPIVLCLTFVFALLTGTICDPGGNPNIAMGFYALFPIIFIVPMTKSISFASSSLVLFAALDFIAKGDQMFSEILPLAVCATIGVFLGIKELKTKVHDIEKTKEAMTDCLTGLTRSVPDYMAEITENINWRDDVCKVIGDIDYLKVYNDLGSHEIGDKVIVSVIQKLLTVTEAHDIELMRKHDAGDEFEFIVTGYNAREIHKIIRECINAIHSIKLDEVNLIQAKLKDPKNRDLVNELKRRYPAGFENISNPTVSIGYYRFDPFTDSKPASFDVMEARAEIAQKYAKISGRDRAVEWTAEIENEIKCNNVSKQQD